MRPFFLVGASILAMGCAGTQHFDATERATAMAPSGSVAAEYEIRGERGRVAEAKVWLAGAYEDRVDGREMTVIEVVFDIENMGPTGVMLTSARIDSALTEDGDLEDLRPFRIEGDLHVDPGSESQVRAYFAIPQRFDPEDIEALEIAWALRHGSREYVQRTPFQPVPEYYTVYPYPYYAPTLYGPYAYYPV